MSITESVVEAFLIGVTRTVTEARHGLLLNPTDHKLMCFLLRQSYINEESLHGAIEAGLFLSLESKPSPQAINAMYNRLIQAPTTIVPKIAHECTGLTCPCDTLT